MRSRCLFALAIPALAALASAQADFDFVVNQAQSNFTWTGTSTLGPIVGNPSTAFQWAGDTHMTLSPSGAVSVASGDFPGTGDAHTVPDLHGKVNGPIPGIPLATIDVTNLHIKLSAPSFAIAANGTYTSSLTLTAISGTLAIHPLIGTPTNMDLTGQASTPTPTAGTVSHSGNNLHLSIPVNSSFIFNDPVSGASGTITVIGTVNADWTCPAATTYCTAKTNSLGCVPSMSSSGLPSASAATPFAVTCANVINQKNGILFYSHQPAAIPFQGGLLCANPPTQRTPVQSSGGSASGSDCSGAFSFDFNAQIQGGIDATLTAGSEVFAQYWSRDPVSASTTSLSNALRFLVQP